MRQLTGFVVAAILGLVVVTHAQGRRGGAPPPGQGQGPGRGQGAIFRAGVELVDVDTVVLDAQTGLPVKGLKRSDFTIRDRKTPQNIATFSEVNFDHEDSAPAFPPGLTLDVADNSSARSTRIVMIVIDDLHITKASTPTTQDLVRRLLRDLGPEATVGLGFTSGRRGVELTEDRAQVYNEIARFVGQEKDRTPRGTGQLGANPCSSGDKSELQSSGYWNANQMHRMLADTAKALGTEATRRKAFVLVSEGLAIDINGLLTNMENRPQGGPCSSQFTLNGSTNQFPAVPYTENDILSMVDAMRRANVATYAINPLAAGTIGDRGGLGDTTLMTTNTPGPRPNFTPIWNRPSTQVHDYLTGISEATGGFAIADSNTLDGGLTMLLNDLDHYYMLGFYPQTTDKSWHDIEVSCNRPGVVVRSRRGYRLDAATKARDNKKEPLANFAANVLPSTELPLKMFATPLPSPGKKTTRMGITMQFRVDRARLTEADGQLRDTLHMLTMAVNADTHKLTPTSIKRERFVTLIPRPGSVPRQEIVYQIVSEWEVPPGHYQLRTSVQSVKMRASGSVYLIVDAPDFNKVPLALSGLVVGYGDPNRHPVDGTVIEHSVVAIEPVLERVFSASDSLRLAYDVWRKNPSGHATTGLEILDDTQHVVRQAAHDVPVEGAGHVDLRVPLGGLKPGPYVLRISAADQGRTVSRELGFFIK